MWPFDKACEMPWLGWTGYPFFKRPMNVLNLDIYIYVNELIFIEIDYSTNVVLFRATQSGG